jgi:hypothetical protein
VLPIARRPAGWMLVALGDAADLCTSRADHDSTGGVHPHMLSCHAPLAAYGGRWLCQSSVLFPCRLCAWFTPGHSCPTRSAWRRLSGTRRGRCGTSWRAPPPDHQRCVAIWFLIRRTSVYAEFAQPCRLLVVSICAFWMPRLSQSCRAAVLRWLGALP